MKILMVEDDEEWRCRFAERLRELLPSIELQYATSRETALELVDSENFDLIILDLEIPASSGDEHVSRTFGFTTMLGIKGITPGTPIIFHSAYGDQSLKMLKDSLAQSEPRDLFGTGDKFKMLDCIDKSEVLECLNQIRQLLKEETDLNNAVEVWCTPSTYRLEGFEKRLIKVFARRRGGTKVEVKPFSGGKSAAKVVGLEVIEPDGRTAILAVGKIARHQFISDEKRRYPQMTSLQPGSHAQFVDEVDAGAGKFSGIFYQLAEKSKPLFDLVREDSSAAADVVRALETIESRWCGGASLQEMTIGDLRRTFINDEKLEALDISLPFSLTDFENNRVHVRWCPQHRDLHGGNVLVNEDHVPVLIDYGMVEKAPACLDAIQLELSLITHSDGRAIVGDWPAARQAKTWTDISAYTEDCSAAAFVQACRSWALKDSAAGRKGFLATVFAYALRQLKYNDIDKDTILGILSSCHTDFHEL